MRHAKSAFGLSILGAERLQRVVSHPTTPQLDRQQPRIPDTRAPCLTTELAWPYPFTMLRQFTQSLSFDTPGRGLMEITQPLMHWVAGVGLGAHADGLLTVFVRHTSASLLIQENADPDVRGDLERFFARLVPDGDALFRHRDEGADDMPAHIRSALTSVQLSVPLSDGRLALGTWQGIYLWEHRLKPHRREVVLHLIGE